MFAPRSRFLPDDILALFTRTTAPTAVLAANTGAAVGGQHRYRGAAAWHVD